MCSKKVLHHGHSERSFAISGLNRDEPHTGRIRDPLLESCKPVLMRRDAENTTDHRHFTFATQELGNVLAGHAPRPLVVASHVTQFRCPVDIRVDDHHRNSGSPGAV